MGVQSDQAFLKNDVDITFYWPVKNEIFFTVAFFDYDIHPHLPLGPTLLQSCEDENTLTRLSLAQNDVHRREAEGPYTIHVMLPRMRGCYYVLYWMRGTVQKPFAVVVRHGVQLIQRDESIDDLIT